MSVETIRSLERERRAAMVAGDIGKLEELLEPEGWYCHGTGERQTNAQWLDTIRTGTFDYVSVEAEDEQIVVFEHAAVVTSVMAVVVRVSGGEELTTKRRLVNVWNRHEDGWRLGFYCGTMLAHGSPDELQAEIQAEVTRELEKALAARGMA